MDGNDTKYFSQNLFFFFKTKKKLWARLCQVQREFKKDSSTHPQNLCTPTKNENMNNLFIYNYCIAPTITKIEIK